MEKTSDLELIPVISEKTKLALEPGQLFALGGVVVSLTLAFGVVAWETRANALSIQRLETKDDGHDTEFKKVDEKFNALAIDLKTSLIRIETALDIKPKRK